MNFKKFKTGSLTLDECYDKQRELYIVESDKLKKEQLILEHQKKMEKAKKVEKLMEKLQRENLNKQNMKQKSEEKAAPKAKEEKLETSTSEPPVKMDTEETKTENKSDDSRTSHPYSCEECQKEGKTFDTKMLNVFESHILQHPHYKPFKCEQAMCLYTSHKRGNLQKHVRSIHK